MDKKISEAYASSKNIYDDILTKRSLISKLYNSFFWSNSDDINTAGKLLTYIPDNFKGKILDVPCGTAVFTAHKWRSLKEADIVCLDYSKDMLQQARDRLSGCDNISFKKGDVGNLPYENNYFDILFSMNGFHAFPEKTKALEECIRVLKDDGLFIACFYIKDENKRTDWLVDHILAKQGWFSPPFLNKKNLKEILNIFFKDLIFNHDGSIAYFSCRKRGIDDR